MKKLLALLCLCSMAGVSAFAAGPTVVRFSTALGDIDVQLYDDDAPKTVANFLGYVDRGDYAGSFIHRSVPATDTSPAFIIQGGGFRFQNGQVNTIPTQPPVVNEFSSSRSNVRGTIAMAKLGNDPNSATDQWFFNLSDNSSNLDNQNGGFTVFGKIVNAQSQAVVDAISALPVTNAGGTFNQLPVINYQSGTIMSQNLVNVSSITRFPARDFFTGEVALDNGVYYLGFAQAGTTFGYYSYLDDPTYIFHQDMGYEYVFNANDGKGGVYLYDFKSGSFFYTSPSFPFPYLYDFSLNTVLYYYPDPKNPGRYNTNGVRYFYNYATGQIIKK